MAAVDKIYGMRDQYYELFYWLIDNNPHYLRAMNVWCYKCNNDGLQHAIASFSEKQDMWLLLNYPNDWLIEEIKFSYLDPKYDDGYSCEHKGCLSHMSHPCENCKRISGRGNAYEEEHVLELFANAVQLGMSDK